MGMREIVQECPVCQRALTAVRLGLRDGFDVQCPRCGSFFITRSAQMECRGLEDEDRRLLSSFIHVRAQQQEEVEVSSTTIREARKLAVPGVQERANLLIANLAKMSRTVGVAVPRGSDANIAASWSINGAELTFLEECLAEQGLVRISAGLVVTPKGYLFVEGTDPNRTTSAQVFVAMQFKTEMFDVFDKHISKAIAAAGYKAHLVSNREHTGKIDDEIVSEIRKSRAIVADFTGHRGGVYFEAGLSMGLNLPVFWTCSREDAEHLHFDIRQYNFIIWSDGADLEARLARRLVAVLGPGQA